MTKQVTKNNLINRLYGVLNSNQQRKLISLQFLVILSAILEVTSVLSIGPFMGLVGNTDLVESNKILKSVYSVLDVSSHTEFLTIIGLSVLFLLIVSSLVSILTIWLLSKFAAEVGSEFGNRLYKYYIEKDYLFHTGINSSEITKKIATEVTRVTDNILQPLVQINARLATILFVSIFIFIYDPLIAISGLVGLSLTYLALFFLVRNRLAINGKNISEYSKKRFKLIDEGLAAIKELEILSRKSRFIDEFEKSGNVFSKAYGSSNALYNIPRYVVELVVFSSMIILILTLLTARGSSVSEILPTLGVFGIAAFKLLPSFQQAYSGAAQIRSNKSAFDSIERDLLEGKVERSNSKAIPNNEVLRGSVELRDIYFRYPGKIENVLNGVSLHIGYRNSVGIVGPSGSGKSTILDILIGAISDFKGELRIGETTINSDSVCAWRRIIGYVSQSAVLTDGTIAENIALGLSNNEIDYDKIANATEIAQLNSWIESLSNGLETEVGEKGLQISGGQRQRIAIARALYNDAEYLFFDEATSALDGVTEEYIMKSLAKISGIKTIVMVAHRLNTVKDCDSIYILDKGKIVAQGSYLSLLKENEYFKKLAGVVDGK